jgi:uncharacterized protein YbaP (TraB family)
MSMGLWRRAAGWIAAAALLAGAGQAASELEAAAVGPAIWTIEKPNGGTIALFGSVHLLPEGDSWRTKALSEAYAKADVLVLETDLATMQDSDLQTYLARNMVNPPGVTLTTLLTPEQKETVIKGAAVAGVSFAQLDGFRPWFAALQLSVAYAVSQGFDPEQGVDKLLEAQGKADGKAFDYFEKAREQLDLFIELDDDAQVAFLLQGAKELIEKPGELKKLVDAWARGDVAAIDDLMNEGMEDSPEVAKALLEDRNARWTKKILAFYLKDKNSYLIIVGAGHLAGNKSVPAMLRDAGIEVAGP